MTKNSKDTFQYGLATVFIVGFFVMMAMLLVMAVPEANEKAIDIMFGVLGSSVSFIVGYFFGSSKGSSEKTEIMGGKKEVE